MRFPGSYSGASAANQEHLLDRVRIRRIDAKDIAALLTWINTRTGYNDDVSVKEKLHQLVDQLAEEESSAAERFLQFLVDGADSSPLSPEDWRAVREGEAAIARGEFTALDDLRRELDL